MSFSNDWESVYKSQQHLSVWPWSDLVTLFMRRYFLLIKSGRKPSSIKVLELGVGAGANVPLFEKLGVEYIGIDGSNTVVSLLSLQYPNMKFIEADFTSKLNFEFNYFDFIIDRASLTHNSTESIKSCLLSCLDILNINGLFIGIDWFSVEHDAYKHGEFIDSNTKKSIKDGYFAGLGNVHFSTEEHLRNLFIKYNIEEISHKVIEYKGDSILFNKFASYNIIASK
jgi:hypothetical protein